MHPLFVLALMQATPERPAELAPGEDSRNAATSDQIKAHNEPLEPDDPDFIRCRKTPVTGSLVKKATICHTNREWRIAADDGNRDARDIARPANFSERPE